jgi:DNA-3-methyladenine glycosylase II
VSLTPRRRQAARNAITTAFRIVPLRPYSLPLTASRFRRFPEVVDRFDGITYRRLLLVDDRPQLLAVTQEGSPTQATLRVRVTGERSDSDPVRDAAQRVVERALGAASDVRSFYYALKDDPILGFSIRVFRGLRIAGWPDVWEALSSTVLCQQVNLTFAYSIRQDLAKALGFHARFDGESFCAFPTPQRIADAGVDRLRQFRLSQAKAETLVRLAHAFDQGDLSDGALAKLPDDAVIERLTAIKGVGIWTAETVLLRGLGRVDAFPAGDLGVVKYLAQGLLRRPEPATEKEMRRYAEAWKPYRGLALVYAYAELQRLRASAQDPKPARKYPDSKDARNIS